MATFSTIDVGTDAIGLGPVTLPATSDPASGTVTVRVDGRVHRIRPWTFGERRRLLDVAARDRVAIDVGAVVTMAGRMLVDPPPDAGRELLLGVVALAWSAGGGASQPAPAPGVDPATQAVGVAGATGWAPEAIDAASAVDVDRWFAVVAPDAGSDREDAPSTDHGEDGFVRFRLEG